MNTDLERRAKPAGKMHGRVVRHNRVLRPWVPAFAGTTRNLARVRFRGYERVELIENNRNMF